MFCNPALKSERDALVCSGRASSQLHFRIHFYELSLPPRRIEPGKVKLHGGSGRSHSFYDKSRQHTQQKCHGSDAQHCQRTFHKATGAPVAEICSRRNCLSPRVRGGSRVHKEFVRRGARFIPELSTRRRHRTKFSNPTPPRPAWRNIFGLAGAVRAWWPVRGAPNVPLPPAVCVHFAEFDPRRKFLPSPRDRRSRALRPPDSDEIPLPVAQLKHPESLTFNSNPSLVRKSWIRRMLAW